MSRGEFMPVQVVLETRIVIQKLPHRHLGHLGIHSAGQIGKNFAHRRIESKLMASIIVR